MATDTESDRRYMSAAHAVQSAVGTMIEVVGPDRAGANAKHLRTGLNLRAADHSALAELLIAKGVFTRAEYFEAMIAATEREAESCAKDAIERAGLPDGTKFA